MSPKRSRTSWLRTRYPLTSTSDSVSVGCKRGSVKLVPSSSGEDVWELCLAMLTSTDGCASNSAGTEWSAERSVGTVRKGSRGGGAQEEHGAVTAWTMLPNSQDTSEITLVFGAWADCSGDDAYWRGALRRRTSPPKMTTPRYGVSTATMLLIACAVVPSRAKFGDRQGVAVGLRDAADSEAKTQSLITTDRFDLLPKLMYAESFLSGAVSPWARYVYVEHERAFNGLVEECYGRGLHGGWGCKPKRGAVDFTAAFDKVLHSFRADGFRSPPHVPIHVMASSGGSRCFVNGAHRIMASYALDNNGTVPTKLVKTHNNNKESCAIYDQSFFKNRGLASTVLDAATLRYLKLPGRRFHAAMLFPVTKGAQIAEVKALLKTTCRIITDRAVSLKTKYAADVFMQHLYSNEAWVDGGWNRTRMAFPHGTGTVHVWFLECPAHDLADIVAVKEEIQSLYPALARQGAAKRKSSIHITSSSQQMLSVGSLVLNANSLAQLNAWARWSTPSARKARPCEAAVGDDERQRYYVDGRACSLTPPARRKNTGPAPTDAPAQPDTSGCLVKSGSSVWVVHRDNTRNWVQYPAVGCTNKAQAIDDTRVYAKRHAGNGAYDLNRLQSTTVCAELTACDAVTAAPAPPPAPAGDKGVVVGLRGAAKSEADARCTANTGGAPHSCIHPLSMKLSWRFDIIVKAMYASFFARFGQVPDYAKKVYLRHLEVWNNTQCLFGDSASKWEDSKHKCIVKHSSNDFFKAFEHTISSVREDGWDTNKSLPPANADLFPRAGAHRIAAAIALRQKAMPVQIVSDSWEENWGFQFFLNKGMEQAFTDYAMLEWVHLVPITKVIVMWPKATAQRAQLGGARDIIRKHTRAILYEQTIQVSRNGVSALVGLSYGYPDWLEAKVDALWDASYGRQATRELRTFFVLGEADQVAACKTQLRSHFTTVGDPKASVHSPDLQAEHMAHAEAVLNPNSVFYLNHHAGKECFLISSQLHRRRHEPNTLHDIMVDSGAVMAYFGMRRRTDIDLLFLEKVDRKVLGGGVAAHTFSYNRPPRDHERAWGDPHFTGAVRNQWDLFYDPQNYGYCHGIRYVSLAQLVRYKEHRGEVGKDDRDSALIKAFVLKTSTTGRSGGAEEKQATLRTAPAACRNWPDPIFKSTSVFSAVDAATLRDLKRIADADAECVAIYALSGTALAAYRNGGPFSNDSDVDVRVLVSDELPCKKHDLLRRIEAAKRRGTTVSLNMYHQWGECDFTYTPGQPNPRRVSKAVIRQVRQQLCTRSLGTDRASKVEFPIFRPELLRGNFLRAYGPAWFVPLASHGVYLKALHQGPQDRNAREDAALREQISAMGSGGIVTMDDLDRAMAKHGVRRAVYDAQISQKARCEAAAWLSWFNNMPAADAAELKARKFTAGACYDPATSFYGQSRFAGFTKQCEGHDFSKQTDTPSEFRDSRYLDLALPKNEKRAASKWFGDGCACYDRTLSVARNAANKYCSCDHWWKPNVDPYGHCTCCGSKPGGYKGDITKASAAQLCAGYTPSTSVRTAPLATSPPAPAHPALHADPMPQKLRWQRLSHSTAAS